MALPPSPPLHPLVQTWRFLTRPLPLLDECAARCGDVFTLRLVGGDPWVFLSRPADLKALFTGDPEALHAGEANKGVFGAITGASTVFTLDEGAHLRQRRLLLPPFHGERMQGYADVIRDVTARTLAGWRPGETLSVQPHTQEITLQVILRTIFGLDESAADARLAVLLKRMANEAVGSPLLLVPKLQWDLGAWSPWGKIVRLIRETDDALYVVVRKRRAAPPDPSRMDILSLLLEARDEEGHGFTDEELRDELVTMLMAGHETTGTALAWAIERYLAVPDAAARVDEELDAVVGDGPVAREHLPKLAYLDAFIKESMRYRPIMPNGGTRRLTREVTLGGYALPPGTLVTNCMYLVHRRADVYEAPERFDPERFLGGKADPYAWTPFGGGVRRCLGMAFALFEMKVALAVILGSARLRPVGGPVAVERRGFFTAPEGGLRVEYLGPRAGRRAATRAA